MLKTNLMSKLGQRKVHVCIFKSSALDPFIEIEFYFALIPQLQFHNVQYIICINLV